MTSFAAHLKPDAETQGFLDWLIHPEGGAYRLAVILPDGRWAAINRFMWTAGILTGPVGDMTGYDERWCYEEEYVAVLALAQWRESGAAEPLGWHRHFPTGRRRPHGDPAKEYVSW